MAVAVVVRSVAADIKQNRDLELPLIPLHIVPSLTP